jgi:hypothetical protein
MDDHEHSRYSGFDLLLRLMANAICIAECVDSYLDMGLWHDWPHVGSTIYRDIDPRE